MAQPIRPRVYALTEFEKEPEQMTLRDCLEWYKGVIRGVEGIIRGLESKYLNERWAFLVDAVAKREGVPTGSLSYYLAELAQAELDLQAVGQAEAEAAGVGEA